MNATSNTIKKYDCLYKISDTLHPDTSYETIRAIFNCLYRKQLEKMNFAKINY